MKQTAVEWLAEICGLQDLEGVIAKAKEMEKEQTMNDFIAGMEFIAVDPWRYEEDAEEYYKETYGGNK